MNIAIFDLDGTLNGIEQRKDLIPKTFLNSASWKPWHDAFRKEKMNTNLIHTAFRMYSLGYHIWVVSNRLDSLVIETNNTLRVSGFPSYSSFFRNINDQGSPQTWKKKTIIQLLQPTSKEVRNVFHFDDDQDALTDIDYHFKDNTVIQYIPVHVNFNG